MTKTIFVIECDARLIAPSVALENDAIRAALAGRNDEEVKKLLDSEF